MAFRVICVGVLLFSLPIAGCGTVKNTVLSRPEEGGKSPFGGVREDVCGIKTAARGDYGRTSSKPESEQKPQVVRMLFFAADLPFSAIGDVVMWPYTWSYSCINQPIPTPPVIQATANSQPQTPP